MPQISEQSERAIKEFLQFWWADLTWKAHETVAGAQLPLLTPDELYHQLLGHTLRQIAAAAEGLLPNDDDLRGEVYEGVQQLCEWMWARPDMPNSYHIPAEWWQSPIGSLAMRAYVWAAKDTLISLSEAARLSGRGLKRLSDMVAAGGLWSYKDPAEPNPRRATRVRRSEVEALPKPRKRADPGG
jgi:hypothetical protein